MRPGTGQPEIPLDARTGTGLFLTPSRLTVPRLRQAIRRVLTEPSFADRARVMSQTIARTGGVTQAADVIERVLETRQPVLARDPIAVESGLAP